MKKWFKRNRSKPERHKHKWGEPRQTGVCWTLVTCETCGKTELC